MNIFLIKTYYVFEVIKMIVNSNSIYYYGKFSNLLQLLKELSKKYETIGQLIKSNLN